MHAFLSRRHARHPLTPVAFLLVAASAVTAAAQERPLEALAPPETVIAIGLAPDPLPEGDLSAALANLDWQGARAAWEALAPALDGLDLDLPEGWGGIGGGSPGGGGAWDLRGGAEDACPGLGDALTGLEGERLVEDALLTVSMGAFSPFPAGLLTVRATDGAADALAAVQDLVVSCFATGSAGSQDGSSLHVIGDGGDLPLVLARHGDLFVTGTRPDVVRAAIRREAGASEASFASGRVGEAMASFAGGGLRAGLATSALADLVETRLPPMADEVAVVARARGVAVLRTFAGAAIRIGLEDEGVVVETLVAVDADGGDQQLAALLACEACRASGPFLAPADAVAVAGGPWRPRQWADYVDSWLVDLSEAAGEPTDLRGLLSTWGLDLDRALLDWVGSEAQFMRLEPFSPDLRQLVRQPPSAVVIPVTSADDARAGLRALADAVVAGLAAAEDRGADLPASDQLGALVSIREENLGDIPYFLVRVGPTAEFAVGPVGNRLLIASPESAFERVVAVANGEARTGFGSSGWRAVTAASTGDRIAWAYGDRGADLRGLADLLDLTVQPLAFAASAAFLVPIEERLGGVDGSSDPTTEFEFGSDFAAPPVLDVATAGGYGELDLAGLPVEPLGVPGAFAGDLDADDPEVHGNRMDLYRITGLAPGDTVTVEMTSNELDTYLYLIDADSGRILTENDDAPTTERSAVAFRADGATDLMVGAASFAGMSEGSYTLSLYHGVVDAAGASGAATIEVLELADAPRYGSVTLPEEARHVLQLPVVIDGELSPADPDAVEVNGNRADLYELAGVGEGDVVTVEMTSGTVDTYLYLIDADTGELIAEVDDSPDTSRSALAFRADADTRVWVGASSWSGSAVGAYRLSVTAADEQEPADDAEHEVADGRAEEATQDGAADAEGDDEAPADAETGAVAPTFDELLPLFEIVPDAVRLVGERMGAYLTISERGEGTIRTVHRQAFDW